MGKMAFLYAGQGSQNTGMGKDLYEAYPSYRVGFDSADLDFDLHEICFENPENRLLQTEYTQPCMVAFACGVTNLLYEKGLKPDYTCGLSLGEYSALYAAGVWDAKTAIETAAFRGNAMAEASGDLEVAMYAIINLDEEKLQECCEQASCMGVVSICNYNCPGQMVIGGQRVAVEKAVALAKEKGAKRCLPLGVSGPFHTSLMKPAGEKLSEYLSNIELSEMKIPVLFNYLGVERDNADIKDLLVKQIQSPVKMQSCIERLFELGVDRFVEIGPGNAISSFVRKTAKAISACDYTVETIDTVEDVENVG